MAIFGLLFEIIISTAFGALVLMIYPKWKLNLSNLIAFNIGSFVLLITTSFFMNLFMEHSKKLTSTFEVISYVSFLFSVFILGGCLGVILRLKKWNN